MSKLVGLSEKQLEVVRHAVADRTFLVAAGATRSGKTYSAALGWAIWLARRGAGYEHALCGRTSTTALRNVGGALGEHLERLGCSVRQNISRAMWDVGVDGGVARIWVVGANDKAAREKIQGSTLASVVFDELPLLERDFFPLAWSRLSVPGRRKSWATLNPEGPQHWAKREVIDRIGDYDGVVVQFGMEHNPVLDARTRAGIAGGLRGHLYRRLVDGEWAGASGMIWGEWRHADEVGEVDEWRLGFDWGSATVAAAVLLGVKRGGGRWGERVVVSGEFQHDARELGSLPDAELASKLEGWLHGAVKGLGGTLGRRVEVRVDPSTPAGFQVLLRRRGYAVVDGDNDVLWGLEEVRSRLAEGNCELLRGATVELGKEVLGYVWDEGAQDKGEDKPGRGEDHLCDALRYGLCRRGTGVREWRRRRDELRGGGGGGSVAA